MDYCAPRGILYEDFLEWPDVSRAAALAWQNKANAQCGSCGTVKADWMTVDAEGNAVEIMPPPMHVTDHWGPGCDALARARRIRGNDLGDGMHLAFRPASPAPTPVSGP